MLLFHGSNADIKAINLAMCRPYKDFGRGFYLTAIQVQANKMAERVSRIYGGEPVLNVFEIDDNFREYNELSIKDFGTETSEAWARFVMNNRNRKFNMLESKECNLDNKYDVVIGPIANDDMAVLFRQYENGIITFENMVRGLIYKETSNQYSFHTAKAVALLKKVD